MVKGQLISKCLWNYRLDQNTNEFFDNFCPGPFRAEIIKFFVGILVQMIFSKRNFEINWPLEYLDSRKNPPEKLKCNFRMVLNPLGSLKDFQRGDIGSGWESDSSIVVQFISSMQCAKPSLKIGSVNKAFLFWYWLRPKSYFFRNKTFLFYKIKSWNFQHLFEK